MKQLDAVLKIFIEEYKHLGLNHLWGVVDYEMPLTYSDIDKVYNSDDLFFIALHSLLESGDYCLFYNLNGDDPSRDGEHLTCSPLEQIQLLQVKWIGLEAMNKMDEENNYVNWWFLIHCPYSLASKMYDENGNFTGWWHASM